MKFPAAGNSKSYRPDIDGLRAIAVLSVILSHIDKILLPGGFIGVDIFFVISGYLISKHILQDIERDCFSVLDFYRRRVKRIAPPMLLVVLIATAVAQLILIPEDAARLADSALWSLLSLSNVYFWLHQDTGYFAAASNQLPLLHLWSLGVEEQFYIVWPLLLMLLYRIPKARTFFIVTAAVALSSFAFGQIWFSRDALFTYYMLPTRAGELLLGALVALVVIHQAELRVPTKAIGPMTIVGLILIAGSLLLISDNVVFPGLLAIPSTLGTALLILAGHCAPTNPISRVLALKPLVWIGLVSYSAYLWHWPLLAFYRYGHAEIGLIAGSVMLVVTFALAWLSYRLIETPGRASRASVWRIFSFQYVVPAAGIALFALTSTHFKGYGLQWNSDDYKSQLEGLRERTKAAFQFDYVCQRKRVSIADTVEKRCVIGTDSTMAPQAILWGDSNAAHYIGVIGVFAREAGFRFRNIEVGSCPPLQGDPSPFVSADRLSDCQSSSVSIMAAVKSFDTVIISASWSNYQKTSDGFLDLFFSEARALAGAGKKVILMGKAPLITGYDRRCSEKALRYPLLQCSMATAPPNPDVTHANQRLKEFAENTPNVSYFDVAPYLCSDSACSAFNGNGRPLYFDRHHLSLPGSWELGEAILRRDGVPAAFQHVSEKRNGAEGAYRVNTTHLP
jgi:peptidoglycan/LPS O-acetylase OafA/YrhL